jgi:hypothetical protein
VLFVTDWQRADFEAMTASGRWPPFDPTRTVLLEQAPAGTEAVVRLARHPSAASSVRISRYENTRVEIAVEAAQAGFVVLHDVWHPWWTADVDGVAAPILKANVLFRAVYVPAGRHRLTFAFHPVSGALAEVGARLLDPLR